MAALASALGVVAALTACGSTSGSSTVQLSGEAAATMVAGPSPSSTTTHNVTDTQFAQMMIVHHQGAVQMAQLAADRAVTYEVRAFGKRIVAAQGQEIERMSAWLTAWGEAPSSGQDGANGTGMAHSGMQVEGMDQTAVTADLKGRNGKDFDRQFLTMMIAHHQSALEMAKVEQAEGLNADAVELSGTIATSQTAEMDEMRAMLGRLGA
ncbi:DUF305 domain-containing protein [Cellulomonas sp. SG140]|uniref:DUF305 domain-containing protein n=1 Tax=Cellulomonas sp. SG140 TaxID=2976536 RepID=UPI0021E8F09D|nr:DUF305 domain-containing protein [Cellulomonas sp. SG140]